MDFAWKPRGRDKNARRKVEQAKAVGSGTLGHKAFYRSSELVLVQRDQARNLKDGYG